MNITKLGHCCLLIEENGVRILTDPGDYSTAQNKLKNIDVVLITHEHGDHLHIESLEKVLHNNPEAKVFTNQGVGTLLKEAEIPYTLLEDGSSTEIKGVRIEGHGSVHAEIVPDMTPPINTGYLVSKRFFYPGDAFHNPGVSVDILALPVSGPWMKLSEAIAYLREVKPKAAFPVHDGMIRNDQRPGSMDTFPKQTLEEWGGTYVVPEGEAPMEF